MIQSNINPNAELINGKVELYLGSTLLNTCTCDDVLEDFTIERVEDNGKFFGFGVCQKTNINLIDIEKNLTITTDNSFKNYFGVDGEFISPYPTFYVSEVNRDGNTNSISITAYDILYKAINKTVADLALESGYTALDMANAIASAIGATGIVLEGVEIIEPGFHLSNANFDGTENLREALNAIAEATQTIYYINNQEQLVFKRLDISGNPVITITAEDFFTAESKTNKRLGVIVHATELGDNVSASLAVSGSTQYVRDNPFWELQENIGEIVETALAAIGGLTINQFEANWGGNFLLEIGDKIALELEEEIVYSYVLNDVVSFMGFLDETTQWEYEDNEGETAANPSTIGEAIKQTYARVDKANKQIDLVVGETTENSSKISQLQITTENMAASVERVEQVANEGLENANNNIETLKTRVDATLTEEAFNLKFQEEREKGAEKVITSSGFTFDKDGLTISKTDSDISTQITDDGMSITRGAEENVLIVNNQGVRAENLKATTYLIINQTSRFEDWEGRTACFWIGG